MANSSEFGLYVPSTYIWDIQQLQSLDVNSQEFKELLVRLYQNINSITIALNLKDSAYYDTNEFINGQSWFPDPTLTSSSSTTPTFRPDYRQVVNFGALPNTATKSVAHNVAVNSAYTLTRMYAAATDPVALSLIPIPYASNEAGQSIELNADATNVNITTGSNRTSYTRCVVIMEYMKF